jgi:hypothetical protein
LGEAAHYVGLLEQMREYGPYVLSVNLEFSSEDDGTDLAWRVSVIFSEVPHDLYD